MLHSYLNFFCELFKFADREFYGVSTLILRKLEFMKQLVIRMVHKVIENCYRKLTLTNEDDSI